MILNVISDYHLWENQGLALDGDVVNLAASIPAYLSLEDNNKPFITTSALLKKNDYQDTWQDTLLVVWDMLQESFKKDDNARPNIILIHAYSLYLVIAQIKIMEKFFNACRTKYDITEIRFENPAFFKYGDSLFWNGLYTSYYHEVAKYWAMQNNITSFMIGRNNRGESAGGINKKYFPRRGSCCFCVREERPSLTLIVHKTFMRATEKYLVPVTAIFKSIFCILSKKRRILFYLRFKGAGLGYYAQGPAVNISFIISFFWLVRKIFKRKYQDNLSPEETGQSKAFEFAEKNLSIYKHIVNARFSQYLAKNYEDGQRIFNFFSRLLKTFKKLNLQAAFIAPSVFVDYVYCQGYVADAFRKNKQKVAGIAHGGNTRLMKRAAQPSLLLDYMADIFFLWGNAGSDEHTECGIKYSTVFVQTGFPRKDEFLKKRHSKNSVFKNTGKPKVLYAPTLLSVNTTLGNNIVWDSYINTLRKAFKILNESSLDCVIKILNMPEIDCLDFSLYPNVKFLRTGVFSDYMWAADYIITDSLGGSPIYEAFFTDKPILFYTGTENQAWDQDFLKKLQERVICFFDGESYTGGLKEFSVDPENYVRASGRKISNDLVDTYMPPVPVKKFWEKIYNTCFNA